MLGISKIKGDAQLLRLIRGVTEDFLNNELPTPRPALYKLAKSEDILEELVRLGFLQQPFPDELIPGLLAFEYGDDLGLLRRAKGCSRMVLLTLADAFEGSAFKQRRFYSGDILDRSHARHKLARKEDIRLGLLLVGMLGKFLQAYQWNEQHSALEWVEVTDQVLGFEDIDSVWTAQVSELIGRGKSIEIAQSSASSEKNLLETAFDQYRLIRQIGEGGAGRVWHATDSGGKDFAIKILHPQRAHSITRKRFQNEILFCSKHQHTNIIEVLDFGIMTTGKVSTPFYVMPLLKGSMRDLILTIPDFAQRLKYFDQLLSGVEAAHLRRVVHRDLKPENVLYDATNDKLVVGDFGIAHFNDEELYTAVETKDDDRLANFKYAAPEQRSRGHKTDLSTDIFALGLMLNELFTGQVPHGTEFKTVASVAPDYAWLDNVIAKMIKQDPQRRLRSIDEVKREFSAQEQEYVVRQRLSEIQGTVIPVSEEDDPLANDPPKVAEIDWKNGELTLFLDRPVSGAWGLAAQKLNTHFSIGSVRPSTIRFAGNRANVRAQEHEVQTAVNYIKTWLPQISELFRKDREQARQTAAAQERKKLQAEKEELERRHRIKAQTRI